MLKLTSPTTGEVLEELEETAPDDVRAAVERARAAQARWAETSLKKRASVMRDIRENLLAHAEEVADIVVSDNGKARQEAIVHEIAPLALTLTYLATKGPRILAPRSFTGLAPFPRATTMHHPPHGVVGVISPWNFPFLLPMTSTITALFAGNGVVIKPSEYTPRPALKARELLVEAGVPEDLLQVVVGGPSTGAALIDSGVNKVSFIGSVAGGKKVGEACGARLIPCTLELGGKAPLVVLPDADLERAAAAAVTGGLINSGQACVCVERVYAHRDMYDALVKRIAELATRVRQGDPSEEDVEIGAITMPRQIEVIDELVQDAVAAGAKVHTGGARLDRPGRYYPPTVLSEVTQDMRVAREEIFGPVLPILRYDDVDHAVELANDSDVGLNAYVFGKDRKRAREVASRIEAGQVMVNDVLISFALPELPFGGVKNSGYGFVQGEAGLLSMVRHRLVTDDRGSWAPGRDPWWFPYSKKRAANIMSALKKGVSLLDFTGRF
jgi:succinate-semialdehyde dehydrogenase/glutarate-semialdehyde dehydrogenase